MGLRDELRDIRLPFKASEMGLPLLVGLLLLWGVLGQPIYKVEPDERGIITTFGKFTSDVPPGLHMKLPAPIQIVYRPKVQETKRIEVGFRTIESGPPARYRDPINDPRMRAEAEMLTGDENIVSSSLIVQFRIKDAPAYLFNVPYPEAALHDLAQSVQRQAVGDRPIDHVLTTGKTEIQLQIQTRLQELTDLYGLGLHIDTVKLQSVQPPQEVSAAFKDVATAKEDRSRIINQARGYANEKIPQARGEAARLMREAEAYRQTRIAQAEGDVARFMALAAEYKKAPEVTQQRLYLETMQRVLPRVRKTILDENSGVINLNNLQATAGGK